jgi:hypothetical protein
MKRLNRYSHSIEFINHSIEFIIDSTGCPKKTANNILFEFECLSTLLNTQVIKA